MGELTSFPPAPESEEVLWIVRVSGLAEGARFELAVHEVDAGFQDRFSARSNSLTTTAG